MSKKNIIEAGSVVVLKHGGPHMTVEVADHLSDRASVIWFADNNQLMKAMVALSALRLVKK